MSRYLLDTNIVINVLKRRPLEVLSTFNTNASRMTISSITSRTDARRREKPTCG
jgi:tRNA(fMet)-specific endonuclease VapC